MALFIYQRHTLHMENLHRHPNVCPIETFLLIKGITDTEA